VKTRADARHFGGCRSPFLVRTPPAIALVLAVFLGCSGRSLSPRDGASESAKPDVGGADRPTDVSGESPGAGASSADGPAGADVPADAPASGDTADLSDAASDGGVARPDGPPAANDTCVTPIALTTNSVHGKLERGGAPAAACGAAATPVLFYSVDVPAGHRLTAGATATAGASYWQPTISAFAGCDATACLARSNAGANGRFRLDWTNSGTSTAHVVLAVAGNVSVAGAEFDLSVSLVDLHASCARPIPVQNGTVIRDLDLAGIAPATNTTCLGDHGSALYFVATVLPRQELTVTALGPNRTSAPVNVALRSACDDTCQEPTSWGPASKINFTEKPAMVLIELTSPVRMSGLFDVSFSLPPAHPAISVAATTALVTTEAGGVARFRVRLESQPSATVTVSLTSDLPSEGTVFPDKLIFDATSWSFPQPVTVTGVDDQVGDGARKYTIVTAPAVSDDPLYNGVDAEDVPLTNLDDEPSLIVDGVDDVVTSEDGTPSTFTVRLSAAPTGNVDVPLASSDTGEGTVGTQSLRFTPANWNVAQVVTVTGADDTAKDGPQEYSITLGPLVSDDARYAGQTPSPIAAHNRDDDFTAGTTTVELPSDACGAAGTPNAFPAAIDALGRIYVVLYCDGELVLLRSDDGGKTVTAPKVIATRVGGGGFALAAARDGVVYLTYEHRDRGFEVARSRDAGKSWSDLPFMPNTPDLLQIEATGDTVLIVGDNPLPEGGFDGIVVLRSTDGGWSYASPVVLPGQTQPAAIGLARDGKRGWMVDDQNTLFATDDAGAGWRTVATIEPEGEDHHCCFVFGSKNVFSIDQGHIGAFRLSDGKSVLSTVGGPLGPWLAATIDDLDTLTIFGEDLLARRLDSSANMLASAKLAISAPALAGALTLSRRATAIVTLEGNHLSFTTLLW
jgi:hypothetical protein